MGASDVSEKAVVVVDTLRATTTMNTMLANGARAVMPVAGVDEARAIKLSSDEVLLVGERHNVPPPDFDGGNSPLEYPRSRVDGRRVVLTTTNGTQAVARCQDSAEMAAGALINASAVRAWLNQTGLDGVIVMAGSEGRLALEDWLAAGAILSGLTRYNWTDDARAAYLAWQAARPQLEETMLASMHGAALVAQGMAEDVKYCAQVDIVSSVAVRGHDGWFRIS